MSLHNFEAMSCLAEQIHTPAGRRLHRPDDDLILTRLDPDTVFDHLDGPEAAVILTTFGDVRENCPNCRRSHLRLVLRQARVRTEHLFCTECECCFDAHYQNGKSALTI